ncbi:hypothetical protein RDI58_022322 [Solanum bulbocastanum]|uniref:Uncharacterized protein n=1 Tax=Solanum bulbocastanum TaxID=147425 RepID=A0AAN8T1W2_SOLBU
MLACLSLLGSMNYLELSFDQLIYVEGSTSSTDITSIWTNVAGGVNKGRVYGLGALPSLCHSSPLLSSASTSQSLEEMEAMRKKNSEMTERLQRFEANFAKVQKFMENIWLNQMIPKKRATLMKSSLCYGCLDIFYEIMMSFELLKSVLNHNLILIRLDFDT